MPVLITHTSTISNPSLVLCIYGVGGVGKSTLASTAPAPIFLDAERGTKGFGVRGIDVPMIDVRSWLDVQEAWTLIKGDETYKTVVIDPVGSFLDLLLDHVRAGGDMNLKKWGDAKDRMRKFIIAAKDSGKHIVFVAHEKEDKDDDQILRRPLLQVNLWNELVNICDVVGHLRIDGKGERSLRVQPEPKYYAKERYDVFGQNIPNPNISEMVKVLHDKCLAKSKKA